MKTWYHVDCFLGMKKTKTSKTINSVDDIDGWDLLSSEDKKDLAKQFGPSFDSSHSTKVTKDPQTPKADTKDNLFSEFQRIIKKIANEPSYNSKSQILQKFLREVRAYLESSTKMDQWFKLYFLLSSY